MRAQLDGESPTILATQRGNPEAISVGEADVFWLSLALPQCSIMRVHLPEGAPTTIAQSPCWPPWNMILDSKRVYWTINGQPPSFYPTSIASAPLIGGPPTQLIAMAGTVFGLYVDRKNLYWTTGANIATLALSSGLVSILACDLPAPIWFLTGNETDVYWVAGNGTVMRLQK